MIKLLTALFTKKDASPHKKRAVLGYVCGGVGIFLNIVLFALKLAVGIISGSISITADAFNNLGDAGSSVISLFGFILSGQKADREHPFGHGRIEYVAGTVISVVIIFMGTELLKSSVIRIFTPEKVVYGGYVFLILAISVVIKLYMAYYNYSSAKKTDSETLRAVGRDSISDSISTLAILVSAVFMKYTDIYIDGFVGTLVSILIIRTGIKSVIETAAPLLGKAPDPKFVKKVEEIVRRCPETVGIHDLVVHDYGAGKRFVSLHMEVDGSKEIFSIHDAADLVEREISSELCCEAVIHMDPIDINNPVLKELYSTLSKECEKLPFQANIHDLRIVPGPTHTNVIFDLILPAEEFEKKDEIIEKLIECVKEIDENYYAVITAETSYL